MVVLLNEQLTFGSIYKSGILDFKDQVPMNPDGSRAYINRKKDRAVRSIYANKRQVLPNIMVDYDSIVVEPVYFKTPHGVTAFVNVISWMEVKEKISIKWEFPYRATVKSNYDLSYTVEYADFAKLRSIALSEVQQKELSDFISRRTELDEKVQDICNVLNNHADSIVATPFTEMGKFLVLMDMSGESHYGRQEFYTSAKRVTDVDFYEVNGEVVCFPGQNLVEVKDARVCNHTKVEVSCTVSEIETELYNSNTVTIMVSGMWLKIQLDSNPLDLFQSITKIDWNGKEYWLRKGKKCVANVVEVFAAEYSHTDQI